MATRTTTDYSKSIFFAWPKEYADSGKVHETSFEDFLLEFVEDPAAAWVIKENEDGQFEVRTNTYNQLRSNKLHGTFETREEAKQFLLDGLNWDFSNKDYNGPSYDFERADLVKFLDEEASADL